MPKSQVMAVYWLNNLTMTNPTKVTITKSNRFAKIREMYEHQIAKWHNSHVSHCCFTWWVWLWFMLFSYHLIVRLLILVLALIVMHFWLLPCWFLMNLRKRCIRLSNSIPNKHIHSFIWLAFCKVRERIPHKGVIWRKEKCIHVVNKCWLMPVNLFLSVASTRLQQLILITTHKLAALHMIRHLGGFVITSSSV